MQECKDRAPGSLEWKDGERERFEKWAGILGFDALEREIGNSITLINEAQEIIRRQRSDINSLKAENEKLRKACSKAFE